MALVAFGNEVGRHTVVWFALEGADFVFTLYNEAYCHRLHTASREGRLESFPKHGRQLEAHDAVEHSSSLLRVDTGEVDAAGMLDGVEDGVLCDFVENYAARIVGLESQDLVEVPCNGLSLAVFIGSQPYCVGLGGGTFELGDKLGLVFGYFVNRVETVVDIDAEIFLFQIAYVAVARHDTIIGAEEFFDCLGFGR